MILLHCALQQTWDLAASTGEYGISLIASKGHFSCYRPSDVNSNNFSFPTTMNYVILAINTDKLNPSIISDSGEAFNISQPIPIDAIVTLIPYTFDNNDKFYVSPEIQDMSIVNKVLKQLEIQLSTLQYFHGGTSSRIILVNSSYIIKQNKPATLESETIFSTKYPIPKLQHILFNSPDYNYVVYTFIPGDVMHTVDDVPDLVENIIEITKTYTAYDCEGYGYLTDFMPSWTEFLKAEVNACSLTSSSLLEYLPHAYNSVETLKNYDIEKRLIHGDFGTHNFIKENGKFVGAIDPIPIAGDYLYDIIYALLSNIDCLSHAMPENIARITGEPLEKVRALTIALLFCRLSICLKHHKEDFQTYIDFWYDITEEQTI